MFHVKHQGEDMKKNKVAAIFLSTLLMISSTACASTQVNFCLPPETMFPLLSTVISPSGIFILLNGTRSFTAVSSRPGSTRRSPLEGRVPGRAHRGDVES